MPGVSCTDAKGVHKRVKKTKTRRETNSVFVRNDFGNTDLEPVYNGGVNTEAACLHTRTGCLPAAGSEERNRRLICYRTRVRRSVCACSERGFRFETCFSPDRSADPHVSLL